MNNTCSYHPNQDFRKHIIIYCLATIIYGSALYETSHAWKLAIGWHFEVASTENLRKITTAIQLLFIVFPTSKVSSICLPMVQVINCCCSQSKSSTKMVHTACGFRTMVTKSTKKTCSVSDSLCVVSSVPFSLLITSLQLWVKSALQLITWNLSDNIS